MVVGFLGRQQVAPGGFALPFGRTPVRVDVTEALHDREFVDLGRAFVCGAGLVMAMQLAVTRLLVTRVRTLGALGGALHVLVRDGLPGGKFCAPAQQLLGALGGFFTRRNGHEQTVRLRCRKWAAIGEP